MEARASVDAPPWPQGGFSESKAERDWKSIRLSPFLQAEALAKWPPRALAQRAPAQAVVGGACSLLLLDGDEGISLQERLRISLNISKKMRFKPQDTRTSR